jgi:lipoprotein-releasing system permease protein
MVFLRWTNVKNNLNTERFIAKRIISGDKSTNRFSVPIVRISIMAIALGLAVMILTVAIITGFKNEIQNKLIGVVSHIQITNYDANSSDEPSPISLHQPFIAQLKKNSEIKHIQVYANKSGILKTETENEGIILRGVSKDYDWDFIKQNLKSGDVFTFSDSLSRDIILSRHFADKLNLKLNDKVVIYFITQKADDSSVKYIPRAKTFFIKGFYETGMEDIDNHLALVDIRHIQKLNYWNEDQIAGFEIAVNDYHNIDKTVEDINDRIGEGLIAETVKERNQTIFSWLELQDINAIIIIVLMISVAGINMISALLVLILERTNMIGILKALGAKNRSVRKIFFYNAAYLIGKGLLWGNIIGISIALLQYHFGIFKLDQTAYYVSVIPININWLHIVFLNIGTMICCLLMLLLPSLIISKITPVKAIQYS